jgi:replicative DNA helicase
MLTDDVLQSNRSNERCILALALRHPDVVHEVSSLGLKSGLFHDRGHRVLFEGILEDLKGGSDPDEATLFDRHAGRVGPTKTWADLRSLNATIDHITETRARRANLRRYVEAVLDAARRRTLAESARVVAATRSLTPNSREPSTIESIAKEACDRALAIASGEADDETIGLGLRDLDSKFRVSRGDYILIGARPSMGKTHFMLSVLQSIAKDSGPVLFNSIEMRPQALGDRLFAHDATGPWHTSENDARASSAAVMRRWSGLPILVDTKSRSLSDVASALRIAKTKHGIVAAGIDSLQLMRLPKASSREQEVAHASRELAALASELGIALFVLCQLNRQLEQRPLHDRRPRMSDLRESGQLEQDADGILFLFREAAYNEAAARPDILEIGIAKQRNGRAPRTSFAKYEPGSGYVGNLPAGEEMRATSTQRRKL